MYYVTHRDYVWKFNSIEEIINILNELDIKYVLPKLEHNETKSCLLRALDDKYAVIELHRIENSIARYLVVYEKPYKDEIHNCLTDSLNERFLEHAEKGCKMYTLSGSSVKSWIIRDRIQGIVLYERHYNLYQNKTREEFLQIMKNILT